MLNLCLEQCGQVRDNIAILRDFLRDNCKGSATMARLDFIGF